MREIESRIARLEGLMGPAWHTVYRLEIRTQEGEMLCLFEIRRPGPDRTRPEMSLT